MSRQEAARRARLVMAALALKAVRLSSFGILHGQLEHRPVGWLCWVCNPHVRETLWQNAADAQDGGKA